MAQYTTHLTDEMDGRKVEFRTNGNGEGLWIDGKQIEGCGQYQARSQTAFRRYVVHEFGPAYNGTRNTAADRR